MARESRIILDGDDPPPRHPAPETDRHAFEWGLASTLIGATLLIMGPVAMLFCLVFWNSGNENHGLSLLDLRLAQLASLICSAGAELVGIVGVIYGFRGLRPARETRQPTALPRTGILLCAASLFMWLIVAINLFLILNTFIRWKEY